MWQCQMKTFPCECGTWCQYDHSLFEWNLEDYGKLLMNDFILKTCVNHCVNHCLIVKKWSVISYWHLWMACQNVLLNFTLKKKKKHFLCFLSSYICCRTAEARLQPNWHCVVPENVHTPLKERVENSWEWGESQRPKASRKCMNLHCNFQSVGRGS